MLERYAGRIALGVGFVGSAIGLTATAMLVATLFRRSTGPGEPAAERTLLDIELPGAIGNERTAMDQVAAAVAPLGLDPARLERLKTAVGEAAMNAIEYGSAGSPDVPIGIEVATTDHELRVRITDRGLRGAHPGDTAEEPDIEAKLAGRQKTRGWGLFLIRNMVDRVEVTPGDGHQTVTLTLTFHGHPDAGTTG